MAKMLYQMGHQFQTVNVVSGLYEPVSHFGLSFHSAPGLGILLFKTLENFPVAFELAQIFYLFVTSHLHMFGALGKIPSKSAQFVMLPGRHSPSLCHAPAICWIRTLK